MASKHVHHMHFMLLMNICSRFKANIPIDPGAASGLSGMDTLRHYAHDVLDELSTFKPSTTTFTSSDGKPEP
eukprot:8631292-Karenia_brevis.AAC.1